MAGFRIAGPQCQTRFWFEIDDGALARMPSPRPGPGLVAAREGGPSDADTEELQKLQDVYGVLRADGTPYKQKVKGVWRDDVAAYVRDRTAFFGSEADYQSYKTTALAELDANNGKLRDVIEPNKAVRNRKKDWKDAQTVFYAWVRKAYEKRKDVAPGTDIPKLILSGTSETLRAALQQVKLDYGKHFQAGGFNPRPMKLGPKYRLGTLSEHAVGNAIDIDDARNAQITSTQWSHILTFTGKSLDHATRKAKWKSAPKDLHELVAGINQEFVTRLARSKKTEEAAPAEAAPGSKPAPKPDPLEAAVTKHDALKKLGLNFVRRWQGGFFDLEWALVKELHEEGFDWGATFSDPDLHHFEL